MLTYTKLQSLYQNWTDDSSDNVTDGDIYLNDSIRTICNLQGGKLRFLEATKNMTTVADQANYQIPNKFRKLIDVYIYSSTGGASDTIYSPEIIFDPTKWKLVLQARFGSSTTPYFVYVEDQQFYINPTPSATGNRITLRGRLNVADLGIADYTTGTVTSIANGATTLVADSTTFTADMVGRFINIPQTTAAGGGDGLWYEIGSFTNATTIELLKPYEGTTIAAGTASYTIGQVPVIPEAYQMAIVYRACALYWDEKSSPEKARGYWMRYDGGNEAGLSAGYGGLIGQMLANEGETMEGSYLPPFESIHNLQQAPYYSPHDNASGLT